MATATLRRAALALAAACALAVPTGAGAAESDGQQLVLEGSRNAYVDFEVTRRTVLRGQQVAVTGGRSTVAVLISPLGNDAAVTSVGVLRSAQLSPQPVFLGFPELQPGRYRARLITEGPTRVAFPVSDGTGRVLRPRSPLPAGVRADRRTLAAGRSSTELRWSGAVPAGRIALLGHVVTGQRLEQTAACVVEPGRRCQGLPFRTAAVDVDPGVRVPTSNEKPIATATYAAAVRRDVLVTVDGYRTTAGELRSVLVTFPS